MSLRIARIQHGHKTTLALSGRVHSGNIQEIQAQMDLPAGRLTLDLKEVTLVDVDTVRYLGICELDGIELLHCAPYIREWISRERKLEEG